MTLWIDDYKKINEEIKLLEWRLNRSETELKRWVEGDLQNVRLEKASNSSKIEQTLEMLNSELETKRKQKEKLEKIINSFDGLENKILVHKYLHDRSLQEIADIEKYSLWHIQRVHAKAMKKLKCQLNANFSVDKMC